MKIGDWVKHNQTKREGVVLHNDGDSVIVNFIVPNWPFPTRTKTLISNVRVIRRKKEPDIPDVGPAPF